MLAVRRYPMGGSLVLLSLLACDRSQPGEPSLDASSAAAPGLTVNAPSDVKVTAAYVGRIDLSWRDNSTNEKGFEVWRSASVDGTFAKTAETGANVTTSSDAAVDPVTPYCYQVRAVKRPDGKANQAIYSAFSNSACAPAGDVQVTTVTTGADLDPDGYTATLEALTQSGPVLLSSTASPINGTVTISRLRAGNYYRLTLDGHASNCSVRSTNPQTVTVNDGSTATVAFDIVCAVSTGNVHVTTTTSGTDLDPDGYSVGLDGRLLQRIASSGAVTISGLAPGGHHVGIADVAFNCEVTGAAEQTFNATVGVTTEVGFAIACDPVAQLAYTDPWDANGGYGDGEIYVINSNGIGALPLTDNAAWDGEPAWSPDGSKLVFTSDRDGSEDIYVMNADGSNPMRLTSDPATDYGPAWSPNGASIAFTSDRGDGGDGSFRIYVMNADGSNPVSLTTGVDPAWSPDGGKIAFTGNQGIVVMNAGGSSDATRLTENLDGQYDGQPTWSPDGAKIAFTRTVCDGWGGCVSHIYVMNADGSSQMPLMPYDPYDQSDPAWSPDGRKIAFSYFDCCLAMVNVDGTNLVDFGVIGVNPVWRPQGSRGVTLARVGPVRAPASSATRARARLSLPTLRRHTPLRFPVAPRR